MITQIPKSDGLTDLFSESEVGREREGKRES